MQLSLLPSLYTPRRRLPFEPYCAPSTSGPVSSEISACDVYDYDLTLDMVRDATNLLRDRGGNPRNVLLPGLVGSFLLTVLGICVHDTAFDDGEAPMWYFSMLFCGGGGLFLLCVYLAPSLSKRMGWVRDRFNPSLLSFGYVGPYGHLEPELLRKAGLSVRCRAVLSDVGVTWLCLGANGTRVLKFVWADCDRVCVCRSCVVLADTKASSGFDAVVLPLSAIGDVDGFLRVCLERARAMDAEPMVAVKGGRWSDDRGLVARWYKGTQKNEVAELSGSGYPSRNRSEEIRKQAGTTKRICAQPFDESALPPDSVVYDYDLTLSVAEDSAYMVAGGFEYARHRFVFWDVLVCIILGTTFDLDIGIDIGLDMSDDFFWGRIILEILAFVGLGVVFYILFVVLLKRVVVPWSLRLDRDITLFGFTRPARRMDLVRGLNRSAHCRVVFTDEEVKWTRSGPRRTEVSRFAWKDCNRLYVCRSCVVISNVEVDRGFGGVILPLSAIGDVNGFIRMYEDHVRGVGASPSVIVDGGSWSDRRGFQARWNRKLSRSKDRA